jgi:prepilin-type processing-associated H-X9-DG protein
MSQVFAKGEWLDGGFNTTPHWRTYAKGSEIVILAKTFLFLDEHPGSINDGSLAVACSSNQPSDPPSSARMIDMPGNWHNGGSAISFADNHVEIHKWRSPYLKNLVNDDNYVPPLNIDIGGIDPLAYLDARWLAERTTVAK